MQGSLISCQDQIRNWTSSRRHTACRAGLAQKACCHQAEETPPSGPQGCTVRLVSKVGKPVVLRPPDARMLSWRFEVSPYRSGGTERGDNPKSRVERFGRRMGRWKRTLAVP